MTCTLFGLGPVLLPRELLYSAHSPDYSVQSILPLLLFKKKKCHWVVGLYCLFLVWVPGFFTYTNSFLEALPSLGLTLLACAFPWLFRKTQKYTVHNYFRERIFSLWSALTAKKRNTGRGAYYGFWAFGFEWVVLMLELLHLSRLKWARKWSWRGGFLYAETLKGLLTLIHGGISQFSWQRR